MDVDIELYRREVRISQQPLVRLSAIDMAPDRPVRTFVLLHGFGGNARQWRYQLQKFSDDSRVIALDLRGHGQSDRPHTDYSLASHVADIDAALAVLSAPPRVVLAGHSFGGALAAAYPAAHPERIERLILIATPGEIHLRPAQRLALSLPLP